MGNLREAARLLHVYTKGNNDCLDLAGQYNSEKRQEIMSLLLGKKVPKSLATCGGLTRVFCEVIGIGGDCHVERERNLKQWAREQELRERLSYAASRP